jgi:hypothetical protein
MRPSDDGGEEIGEGAMSAAERLAESVYAKLVFRYGTPALLVIGLWLGGNYVTTITDDLKTLHEEIAALTDKQGQAIAQLDLRLTTVETDRRARIEASDATRAEMTSALKELRGAVGDISNKLTEVQTKVEILIGQKRADLAAPLLHGVPN